MKTEPVLYVKTGCPWCLEVQEYLTKHGIRYQEKNVSQDSSAFSDMQRRSGQTKAPVLDWDGKLLADFGVDELKPFLRQQGVG
ncbi:MAG: glutaredoxin [Verrucomicrobia bacterium]|nr:glutaredoxin [Verrucomicrobiota bacterium]